MSSSQHSYFTVDELSSRWKVSKKWVRRAIWDGRLSATRFGKLTRIAVSEVDRFESCSSSERRVRKWPI